MSTTPAAPNPRVGVAAIVKNRAGQFVVGRRKGAHGAGKWQFPGGHLDFGESPEECAVRETLEETGLVVTPLGILSVTNDVFAAENKHYITFCVLCLRDDDSQEAEVFLSRAHVCDAFVFMVSSFGFPCSNNVLEPRAKQVRGLVLEGLVVCHRDGRQGPRRRGRLLSADCQHDQAAGPSAVGGSGCVRQRGEEMQKKAQECMRKSTLL